MRPTVISLCLSVVLVALPGAGLSAPKPKQTVEGTVVLPTPHPQDPSDCFAGYQRRFAFLTQEQINSIFGFHFDVDRSTWGGKFVLEPTGGLGTPDLDIIFFESFTTDVTDPASGPPVVEIGHREPGGETGTVPPTMTKAIVCLWAGDASQAAATPFRYTAFTPVKKKRR